MSNIRRFTRIKPVLTPRPRRSVRVKDRKSIARLALAKAAVPKPPYVGQLEKMFRAAIEALRLSFDTTGALGRGISAGTIIGSLDWAAFGRAVGVGSFEILGKASKDGAAAVAEAFDPSVRTALRLALQEVDPAAVAWADRRAGDLIREISDVVRSEIRGMVTQAVAGQYDTFSAAAMIQKSIGLTGRQASWVSKNYDLAYKNGLANGLTPTLAASQAVKTASSFADRLLQQRAETIARTEIAKATMAGREIGYQNLFDTGIVDPAEGTHSWLPDPSGACPICTANADQGWIPFSDSFASGDDRPPAHPNCECDELVQFPTTAVTIPDDLRSLVGDLAPAES